MAVKEKEVIVINNVTLEVNPTDIISRQKRRIVKEEYIRENSVFAHMGKYGETTFTIFIQFNVQDEINKLNSPGYLPGVLKLLCQIDNFPFVYIKSSRIKKYLTQTGRTKIDQMIFGLKSYTLAFSSESNNTLTLKLDLEYFNHVPFASDISFYNLTEEVGDTDRTRVVNQQNTSEFRSSSTSDLRDSDVFDRYFDGNYHDLFNKLIKYKSSNGEGAKPVGLTKIRYPIFLKNESEGEDYSEISLTEINDNNDIVSSKLYATWKDLGDISTISNSSSPISSLLITKYNNFASHSLTAWAYPVLQYIGKGTTIVDLSFAENSLDGYSLQYIKTLLGILDTNQLDYYRHSQFNVLKIDNIVLDIIPMFGFILDNEEIKSSAQLQEVDSAFFRFIGKDVSNLMERRGFNSAHVRDAKIDTRTMTDTLKSILESGETNRDRHMSCVSAAQTVTSRTGNLSFAPVNHSRQINQWPSGLNDRYLNALEDQYGLPRHLLYNVMMQESGGRTTNSDGTPISSSSGAEGVFQFTAPTASDYNLTDPHDPREAAGAAARYYKSLSGRYNGDVNLMLAAYNSGPGNVNRAVRAAEAATGRKDWNTVKNYLVTSQSNQEQTRDYVQRITTPLAVDSGINERPSCYNTNEVDVAVSQVEELTDKINELIRPSRRMTDEQRSPAATLEYMKWYAENENIGKGDAFYSAKNLLEETFLSLNAQADAGNAFLSIQTSATLHRIRADSDRLINSFEGEAYYDLQLGNRLGTESMKAESGGLVEDPRDINPMFFMESKPYITSGSLKRGYQGGSSGLNMTIAQVTKKMHEKINKSTSINVEKALSEDYPADDKLINRLKDVDVSEALNDLRDKLDSETLTYARGSHPLDMVKQGPGNEDEQAFYYFPRSSQPFDRGINQAFPVIKAFIVEGDEDSIKSNLSNPEHEYYELTGLVSVKIAHQDEISPVDVAVITIANPGSIYTDQTVYMDMVKPEKNWEAKGTRNATNIPMNRLRLRPGNRLHIRGGYSNDINKLETMFNGIVTEVYGESTLQLVCESYGRELVTHDHGDDPTEDNWWGGADTSEVIANFLYAGEIEHFGNIKFLSSLADTEGEERRVFTFNNLFSYFGSHALFINIYTGNVIGDREDFGADWFNAYFLSNKVVYPKFPIYKITPWEALKEMEYRHPGSLMRPCNYGDRHTMFFGIKEQLYVYRDLHSGITRGNKIGSSNTRRGEGGSLNRDKRLKPVSDMHIISSDLNIISNSLKVMNDYDTVVDVAYWFDADDFRSQKYEWYQMKVDDNLRPMDHRNGRLQMNGINGKYAAFTYGSTHLRKEAEKMYDGKILIIGNQNIKSGDYALLDDSSRDLYGIIKIRECIQHFDTQNGFVTEIVPGLFAESSHTDYSFLFAKLGIGYSRTVAAARSISRESNRGNDSFARLAFYADLAGLSNNIDINDTYVRGFKKFFTEEGAGAALNQGLLGVATAASGYTAYNYARTGTGIFATGLRITGQVASFTAGAAGGAALRGGVLLEGLVGRSALLSKSIPIAKGLFAIGRAMGPIGWAGAIIGAIVSAKIEESELTRQPIRFFPLEMGGKPYVGGMLGYTEGGYWEDLGKNISTTYNNILSIKQSLGY